MMPPFEDLPTLYEPHLKRAGRVLDIIERAYRRRSESLGFHCAGCEDNCCLTRFHHHTVGEYLYLREGFFRLTVRHRARILDRARDVNEIHREAGGHGPPVRAMCPLNEEGRCLLYRRRPMICRLHGIPYEFRRPDGGRMEGPGCDAFHRRTGRDNGYRFDRTPYYREMALMERDLRAAVGFSGRMKMTVAEMVETFFGSASGEAT